MTHNKHPLTVRPPYPDDSNPPPEVEEPYSPSLLESPAFDLTDLEDAQAKKMTRGPSTESDSTTKAALPEALRSGPPAAQKMGHGPSAEDATAKGGVMLPDSLRIGAGGVQKDNETPRKSLEGVDISDALQPGGGNMKDEVSMRDALGSEKQEARMHGGLVTGSENSEDVWGDEKTPIDRRESDPISPVQMSANLSASDRPFSEYSPFYNPTTTFNAGYSVPVYTSQATKNRQATKNPTSPPRPPPVVTNSSDAKARQHSIASSISSVGFDPGMDLSCFDASTTRALPGRRGYPTVGMDGWKEDDAEDDVAKTWEEELDRRAKAGAELQRRNEEAQEREKEERLQAEFWEEERRLATVIEGPQKPPKSPSPVNDVNESPAINQTRPVPPVPVDAMANMHIRPPPVPPPSANTTTEIYQIKHITWIDPCAPSTLRHSPILLQNANGPCPLLALVNALILSTPVGTKTALREILELREQVSLELLLDAVFQELMDRGGTAGLPDVGDLFAFLLTLHTGMNVNPRFYLDDEATHGGNYDTRCFEKTREMELYGAFKVPLVHGWLPPPSDPVLAALKRRNISNYEEAQTLLFHEEEIISRITAGTGAGLAEGEGQIVEDSSIIREWMERSKTQLTTHGLEVVKKGLNKGDVAILFRNDHFMTVIGGRDPGALMGLVTDMGFAGHEEVVWERMVDVQGRDNEFLSGDFRPVGGGTSDSASAGAGGNNPRPRQEVRSLLDPDEGWETIPGVTTSHNPGDVVDHDADLALAMQLQEEEDARERHRRDAEQRHRRHASSQSVGGQPRNLPPPPPTPPRRGGGPAPGPGQFTHRPADGNEVTPPPPYERLPVAGGQPQNMSAYQQQQYALAQQQRGHGRRASFGATTSTGGIQASGGMSAPQRRAEAARGLMAEIAASGGGSSGGAQGSGTGHGRRPSLPGTEQEGKEKCIIC